MKIIGKMLQQAGKSLQKGGGRRAAVLSAYNSTSVRGGSRKLVHDAPIGGRVDSGRFVLCQT